jgi:hypothetical protein
MAVNSRSSEPNDGNRRIPGPRGLRPLGLRVVITGQTLHDNHMTRPTASVGIRGNENIFVRGGLSYS